MKYAHIEENTNKLLGWYDDEVHSAIPVPNIEVTEEQWLTAINGNHNKVNLDGSSESIDFRTEEEILAQLKINIESAIQAMIDEKARSLRYDSMMSARSYTGYVNPFQVEAQALAVWCAECWIKAGELEALGTPMTVEEVLAQMPIYAEA